MAFHNIDSTKKVLFVIDETDLRAMQFIMFINVIWSVASAILLTVMLFRPRLLFEPFIVSVLEPSNDLKLETATA